jgi:hypothetical protein
MQQRAFKFRAANVLHLQCLDVRTYIYHWYIYKSHRPKQCLLCLASLVSNSPLSWRMKAQEQRLYRAEAIYVSHLRCEAVVVLHYLGGNMRSSPIIYWQRGRAGNIILSLFLVLAPSRRSGKGCMFNSSSTDSRVLGLPGFVGRSIGLPG